jgi:predicted dehydrogenase
MSIGFGIVGLGMIADFHARALQAASGAELVACASRSAAKAQEFGATHGCAGYHDLQQFLRHPGLQVVSIATPSGAHLEPALAAIDAGKHLIVEKPLEVTRERCARLLEAAARRGVVVAGIFPSRFLEVSRLIKEAIDGGRLGRIVLGDAYIKWYRTQQYYDEGGWHGTRRLDGGGALMNQSIHAIDLLQWFMGPVTRVVSVTATLGHRGIEVEDTAAAVVQFANGALGTIEGSTAAYPGFHKRVEVYGTAGSVASVQDRLETWTFAQETAADAAIRAEWGQVVASGGGASNPADIGIEGHQAQFEDLVQALHDGRAPAIDGAEACRAVHLILAIYESAATGRPVELEPGAVAAAG